MPTGAQNHHARPRKTWINNIFLNRNSSIFFITILVLVVSCGAQGENESRALLNFKASLRIKNHHLNRHLASWTPLSGPPCSGNMPNWPHVLCYNGFVFGLKLENMNLTGPINVDPLVPLRSLRTLSFMWNDLESPMPDWRKLGALKSLYLSNNRFSGQISEDAFKGMFSLKKIDMANNNFTGPMPTSLESPKLIELRLENNGFTGHIPLISSEHLKIIDVSNNQLEGPIPAPLRNMTPASFSGYLLILPLTNQTLGNKALCGPPLDTPCPLPVVVSNPDSTKLRTAVIVISILAALFAIATVLLLLVAANRRRRHGRHTPRLGRAVPPDRDVEASSNVATLGVSKKQQKPSPNNNNKLSFVSDERRSTFELHDLMTASAEVLGSGNLGASYKAVLLDSPSPLVVKRFKQMTSVPRQDFFEHMARLGNLRHPNLLPLVAYLYRKHEKLLVFDYAANASLAAHLHNGGSATTLPWPTRLTILRGVCRGLAYLHRELPTLNLPHGHLKSSNVLLDAGFNPLLADYALSPVINSEHVERILVGYKAPGQVGRKADVWCLGVLMLEVVTGKCLDLTGGYVNGIVGEGAEVAFDEEMAAVDEEEMRKVVEIAKECCREEAEKRLDMEEVVRRVDQLHKEC
ncbi:leucine-rich repeat protein kinase family protein [Striga asiatica]|uniref:Leucine-rich repeat protein kinase family protein n=1 Tax=Striga asiatica TaxID=4170 RepID=A0A5A7P6Q9_STRAF|nr:leucine-rich repeat protein kinase family protein [Striga asiatica]